MRGLRLLSYQVVRWVLLLCLSWTGWSAETPQRAIPLTWQYGRDFLGAASNVAAAVRALDGIQMKNVRAYGAKGDGSTNDTQAFYAAFATGQRVFVPAGVYRVSNLMLTSRMGMECEAEDAVRFIPATNGPPVIWINSYPTTTNNHYGTYANFTIDCQGSNVTAGLLLGTNCVGCGGNSDNSVKNVHVINNVGNGIEIMDAVQVLLESVVAEDNAYGLYISNERSIQTLTVVNSRFRHNKAGGYMGGGTAFYFISDDWESNLYGGLLIQFGVTQMRYGKFSGNWFENNGSSVATNTWQYTNASIYFVAANSIKTTNAATLVFENCKIGPAANAFAIAAEGAVQNVLFDRCGLFPAWNGTPTGFNTNYLAYKNGEQVFITFRQCGGLNELPSPAMYANWPPLSTGMSGSTLADYGFFYEYDFLGQRYSNRRVYGIAGSPVGVLTPHFDGEVVNDTTNGKTYRARGLTSSDWILLDGIVQSGTNATLAGAFSGDTLTGTNGITVGGGTRIKKILEASAALDFPNILAAASADLTVTVTGAVVNDTVSLGLPAAPTAGITFNGFVSAADTVTVRAHNYTGGAIDPASQTVRVTVLKY